MRDTICAVSTANGQGAMAIVRLSGIESIAIASKVFKYKSEKELSGELTRTAHFGRIYSDNEVIDEVIVTVFKAPNTYTAEDIVEITCHGSVYIQQKILQVLIASGARLATPGEFTQRAYMNGKLDLSQAEAVSDLISSSSKAAHKIALNQMRGGVSNKLKELRAELLQFISLIELELDFSEEDVEFANRDDLKSTVNQVRDIIQKLIKSFELGNAIKNGVPVAIVGEPNVGKSTLLNLILGEERAIVSDIAGTTRDAIEDTINIGGIEYRFIDTAGLRETDDTIEKIGIEWTYKKIEQAKVILAMFDILRDKSEVEQELNELLNKAGNDKKVIVVFNKADEELVELQEIIDERVFGSVCISAKTGLNIDNLLGAISGSISSESIEGDSVVISNARHLEALSLAEEALDRVLSGLSAGITTDFVAMDIRETIHHLAGITGEEITTDEILGNIFGQFCIGK